MYSKAMTKQTGTPYRIPDNYRGHAFDPAALPEPDESENTDLESTEMTTEPMTTAPSIPDTSVSASATGGSLLSSFLPPKPNGIGGFLQKFGTEELLILGLILLLSGSENDDDILPLLLLLLFYK